MVVAPRRPVVVAPRAVSGLSTGTRSGRGVQIKLNLYEVGGVPPRSWVRARCRLRRQAPVPSPASAGLFA